MLRALLSRKKTEQFAKLTISNEDNTLLALRKHRQKRRIIEKIQKNELFK